MWSQGKIGLSTARGTGISVTLPGTASPATSEALFVAPTVQHLAQNQAGPPEHLSFLSSLSFPLKQNKTKQEKKKWKKENKSVSPQAADISEMQVQAAQS